MTGINFVKMQASGNDFVVVDNRRKVVKNPVQFTQKVCRPHIGIGADGVLLLEKSRRGAFKMRILNADGSEAEACGNGFRCIARYAHEKLGFPKHFKFESLSGLIDARVEKDRVSVQLAHPRDLRRHQDLIVLGRRLNYSFINTGVPHAVIFVHGLSSVNVQVLGKAVREHRAFRPKGTNVNFVEVKGLDEIHVRTYERGVEDETLACGTGSTASALMSALMGYVQAPVRVKTRSGEILTIDFKIDGHKITEVFLIGQAQFIYEGKLSYEF